MTTPTPIDPPLSPGEVAQHLRRMRKAARMTLQAAADHHGWSIHRIEAWEGGRNLHTFCEVLTLFDSYGVTVILKPPRVL